MIARLRTGNIDAFDFFYHKYKHRAYGLVIRVIKLKEETEGLVHDCFIQLWEKREMLDENRPLGKWLFTVAYNLTIDRLRHLMRRNEYVEYLKHVAEEAETDTENQVNYSQLKECVNEIISGLPAKRKEIYRLSREEGMSNKEIAEKLGISQNTVENQLVSALKAIREGLRSLRSILFSHLF